MTNQYVTGAMIKRLREKRHLTQAELAEKICVTDKAVSKWETGRGLPDISLLEVLAKALGVSVIELLSGENITNKNKAAKMSRARLSGLRQCNSKYRRSCYKLLRNYLAATGSRTGRFKSSGEC